MMETSLLRSEFSLPNHTKIIQTTTKIPFLNPQNSLPPPSIVSRNRTLHTQYLKNHSKTSELLTINAKSQKEDDAEDSANGVSRIVIVGAASLGFVLLLIGMDEHKALALGPEGPLMEEFWDNMRRYALYVLTVSTGVAYTVLQPIVELLKNPVSAILILTILGGSIYIVSQVLSAMVGVSDFSYDYGY
ncbi:hypothetical protein Ancab_004768 [Ancistrocladus abbreviatus]